MNSFRSFDSFPDWKNSERFRIFKVVKFWTYIDFPIWKIPKIFDLESSKNVQSRKL